MSKVLPKDNRRYNGQTMQELAMNHTFKPKMAPKSKLLAEQYQRKLLKERSKSRKDFQRISAQKNFNPFMQSSGPHEFVLFDYDDDEEDKRAEFETSEGRAAPFEMAAF